MRAGTRDSQKAKLYRAEREAFGSTCQRTVVRRRVNGEGSISIVRTTYNLEAPPPLSVHECEQYIAKVWNSPWTRRHFQLARAWGEPRVKDGRGTRIARGCVAHINLPLWARCHWVILHEVTHALTPEMPWHGWEYARNYLMVVQHFLGKDKAQALKVAFRKHHVRFAAKKRLTPERLEALRAHGRALAAARWKDPS